MAAVCKTPTGSNSKAPGKRSAARGQVRPCGLGPEGTAQVSAPEGRQRLAPGFSPGLAGPHILSPGGATAFGSGLQPGVGSPNRRARPTDGSKGGDPGISGGWHHHRGAPKLLKTSGGRSGWHHETAQGRCVLSAVCCLASDLRKARWASEEPLMGLLLSQRPWGRCPVSRAFPDFR